MSLIILLSSLLSLAAGQLSVSLVDTAVMVNEGEQFALRVRKSGPITQSITVIVEVSFQGFSFYSLSSEHLYLDSVSVESFHKTKYLLQKEL